MLSHAPRRPRSSLIFDVRQKRTMIRLFLGLLLSPSAAFACSCLPSPPISNALKASDFVIHARCTSFAITSDSTRVGIFDIVKVFKGEKLTESCTIETGISSAGCGFDFIAGNEYLIYGGIFDGVMRTSICTRTMWLYLPRHMELEYSALEKMVASPAEKWKDFDLPERDPRDPFK